VVSRDGRAYVGTFGFDWSQEAEPSGGPLVLVDASGAVSVVAEDLLFANGIAIRPDGTLVVGESYGARLTAFDIDTATGALSGRRVLTQFDTGSVPDGICIDSECGVWVTLPSDRLIVRVDAAGRQTDVIETPGRRPYTCVLGGADRRDLYVCTALGHDTNKAQADPRGRVERVRVAIAGAEGDGVGADTPPADQSSPGSRGADDAHVDGDRRERRCQHRIDVELRNLGIAGE
jgi:sugar lactone lactonase YvrE